MRDVYFSVYEKGWKGRKYFRFQTSSQTEALNYIENYIDNIIEQNKGRGDKITILSEPGGYSVIRFLKGKKICGEIRLWMELVTSYKSYLMVKDQRV